MVRLGNLALFSVATPGHTAGALTWRWGACDGGVYQRGIGLVRQSDGGQSRRVPFLRPSTDRCGFPQKHRQSGGSQLRDSAHAPSVCEQYAQAASGELRHFTDPNACRDYAASLTKRLDERLATENAGK